MDKGLLVKPANGAAYPKEILEVAALTKLTPEQVRESASRGQKIPIRRTTPVITQARRLGEVDSVKGPPFGSHCYYIIT